MRFSAFYFILFFFVWTPNREAEEKMMGLTPSLMISMTVPGRFYVITLLFFLLPAAADCWQSGSTCGQIIFFFFFSLCCDFLPLSTVLPQHLHVYTYAFFFSTINQQQQQYRTSVRLCCQVCGYISSPRQHFFSNVLKSCT